MLTPEADPRDRLEGYKFPDQVLFLTNNEVAPTRDVWLSVDLHELPTAIRELSDVVSGWKSYEYWVGVGQSRVAIARRDNTSAFDPQDVRAIASEFLGFEATIGLVMPGFGRFHYAGCWVVEILPDQGVITDAYLC